MEEFVLHLVYGLVKTLEGGTFSRDAVCSTSKFEAQARPGMPYSNVPGGSAAAYKRHRCGHEGDELYVGVEGKPGHV